MPREKVKWNLSTGICPFGHPLSYCHTTAIRKIRGREYVQNVCRIKKSELAKEAKDIKNGKIPPKIPSQRSAESGEVELQPMNIKCGRFAEQDNNGKALTILLVCEHETLFKGHYISFRFSNKGTIGTEDPPLYCRMCQEYRHIHQIDSIEKGQAALVVWPLGYMMEDDPPKYRLANLDKSDSPMKATSSKTTPLNTGWQT